MSSDDTRPREVLSSLPHTRPQRRSAKRDAARKGAAKPRSGLAKSKSRPVSAATPSPRRAPTTRPQAVSPPFRAEPQGPVTPPSGSEILGAALETAGELAQIGVNVSKGLLRSVASRLPRP